MAQASSLRVLVTGAAGNLGRKLIADLLARPWCESIVAVDRGFAEPSPDPRILQVAADLVRPSAGLDAAMEGADAVVHLAAQNPYPDASWADCCASFDMTLTLIEAAARGRPRRFVFASSNHVMGGYKDAEPPLAAGALTADLPPRPGTRVGPEPTPAYAVAKLMGERLLAGRAAAGGLTTVSLRIGWCQPGENHPRTLSAGGVPGDLGGGPEAERDLVWFRSMWLSDRDFAEAVAAALTAEANAWPAPAIVVNAMSDNAGMAWDLKAARRLTGYAPRDDVWRALEADRA